MWLATPRTRYWDYSALCCANQFTKSAVDDRCEEWRTVSGSPRESTVPGHE